MQTSVYNSLKIKDAFSFEIEDTLVVEAPIEIVINSDPFAMVMRTPGNDAKLVRGLLYAEDVYKGTEDLKIVSYETKKNGFSTIKIEIPKDTLGAGYLNKRSLLSISACGICGKKELKTPTNTPRTKKLPFFEIDKLAKLFQIMKASQYNFELTGGSHAAAIFDNSHRLLNCYEDIGRHNAVDKCIGDLLEKQQLRKGEILLVSGRVSYEIISKAFLAKIQVLVAVSACSSLAVDYAKEFGICLIGFSRNQKATIYANPNLVKFSKESYEN
ncbi:MAG: formate dehydrogenase accessory sulfurtransferase FdhD [Flavicella sp.]